MIRELHAKIKSGEKTARQIAEDYLTHIKTKDSELLAFLTVLEEQALIEADAVDEAVRRGESIDLLAGVPGALKDNLCIAGKRTTAGSKILDNFLAPYSATVVERLAKCGAVILGKTNMDEFAFGSSTENSAYQKTKNPHDPTRVPGGSSGGSAAAVAAGMAAWALGSDTGGSIREPAAFCGIVGLKPTYGRVSRSGLIAMASSLDQIGPMTTSAEDAAILLTRLAGKDALDATTTEREPEVFEENLSQDIQGLRIGLPKEYFAAELDPAIRAMTETALEYFRSRGAKVIEVELPHSPSGLPVYYILMEAEVSSNLARFDGIRYGLSINDQAPSAPTLGTREGLTPNSGLLETYLDSRRIGFGDEVKRRIMLGTYALSAGYYDAYYQKAQKVRSLIREDFNAVFKKVDVIFSPTVPEVAFRLGEKTADPLKMYLSDIYTVTANLAGVPAISFPLGTIDTAGRALPVGGQFMGKWFDEAVLLSLVHAFEQR